MNPWLRSIAAGLIWLTLLAALPAAAAGPCPPPLPDLTAPGVAARDHGLLWKVTRDGRTSYLYGTLHVGKPAWRGVGPRVAAALRASDVLALEIDPADPALLEALAEPRSPLQLAPGLAARLALAFERACLTPESLTALHPLLQATTLTVLEARWLGLDPNFSLEQILAARMRTLGRRVVALETVAQQISTLVPADEAQALTLLEQSLTQLEDGSGRRVLERLARAWEGGDVAALEDFESWCECAASDGERAFMRRLNDECNPLLADGIAAQHALGRRVFAAVGALHMTGPKSLPRLLAERGFRVERVDFTH